MWVSHAAVLMGKVARWIFHDELEAAKTAAENARGRCDGWQRKVEELEAELARERKAREDLARNLDQRTADLVNLQQRITSVQEESDLLRASRARIVSLVKTMSLDVFDEVKPPRRKPEAEEAE